MDFFRRIMLSDELAGMFELPKELRHKQVEVLVLPVVDMSMLSTQTTMVDNSINSEIEDSLFSIKGAVSNAPADLATNPDKYLY